MNNCLLIIDLQNDYFPGGAMQLVGAEAAAVQARLLLDTFRRSDSPIIHIQHLAVQPGAAFFLPGTTGAGIHPLVAPREDETVVVKNYPNSFRSTPLLDLLKQGRIDYLTVCGAMSHMCIDATVRAAFDLGFHCTVAADACATRDLAFQGKTVKAEQVHAAFMAALSAPYATVLPAADLITDRA